METLRLTAVAKAATPCVATIGFFDGVHRGHRFLIRQVTETAKALGISSTIITFDRHPRQVVKTDYRPRLLSTLSEKLALLDTTQADRCVVLPFDEAMARLSAKDFMQRVLHDKLNVHTLIIGYDNRFGHDRTEGFEDYVAYGETMGMDVRRAKPFLLDGVNVSSSVVRTLLSEGEVSLVAKCLGHDYTVIGNVAHGEHIGTSIGYPTANLQPNDPLKLIPAGGVYAARVRLTDGAVFKSMVNIGMRPTFNGDHMTIEAHLLHFTGNIYGATVEIAFVSRLRAERKFHSATELSAQLRRDAEAAEEILSR